MFKFNLALLLISLFGLIVTFPNQRGESDNEYKPIISSTTLTSVNGGNNCLTCTIIVALVEQLSIVYNQTAERSLQALCKFLPQGLFRTTCQNLVKQFGSVIINGSEKAVFFLFCLRI